MIRDAIGRLPGFARVLEPSSPVRRRAWRAQRLLLRREGLTGVVRSAHEYVASELVLFAQANAQSLEYWYLLCPPAGRGDLRVEISEWSEPWTRPRIVCAATVFAHLP
ncbi:MAG TPA: hypothetical protein VII47_03015 [Actinomycetota bacterium]|jgi:hypothetical protein